MATLNLDPATNMSLNQVIQPMNQDNAKQRLNKNELAAKNAFQWKITMHQWPWSDAGGWPRGQTSETTSCISISRRGRERDCKASNRGDTREGRCEKKANHLDFQSGYLSNDRKTNTGNGNAFKPVPRDPKQQFEFAAGSLATQRVWTSRWRNTGLRCGP